jgi:hypothetical protein
MTRQAPDSVDGPLSFLELPPFDSTGQVSSLLLELLAVRYLTRHA